MINYPHIIEDLDIALWEYYVDTQQIKCNEKWANIVGYSLTELTPITSKTWENLFHPKYLGKSDNLFAALLEDKIDHYKCEIRLKHKKGHSVWIYAQGRVSKRDDDGKPLVVTGFNRDITEKKKDQRKLQRYKDITEIASKIAKTGYWELNFKTNNFFWNEVTKKIFRQSEDYSPNSENFLNYFAKGVHRKKIEQAVAEVFSNKKEFDLEILISTGEKSEKWVRIIGVGDFKKKKCIRLYGLVQDIDDIKRIRIDTAIKEEQFRQTFEHATIGMALVGLDGSWLKVNEGLNTFLGYSNEEFYKLTFQDITHPDDLNKDLQLLEELVANKRKNYQMEKRYVKKNGQIVWAHLSVSLVRDDKDNPIHFVSQVQDINENKKLSETMLDQNRRLLNFAYIVSHNLGSHTGNLTMLLDLMVTENESLKNDEYFSHLLTASTNLTETVMHLNEVVKINIQSLDNLEPLNLQQYILNAISHIQASITSTNANITNTVSEDIYVAAFPAYLESIILNFLTNAIKYRSPERTPQIKISAKVKNEQVIISIEDNGIGIDLDRYGTKLFGMYKTFHNNKDSRGIGLFITKNQVEALGGKIEVKSELQKGSEFKIFLKKSKKVEPQTEPTPNN